MHPQRKLRHPLAAALIAAAIAGPALGQSQGLSPTGPGTAAAARVSTATATVTAIDLPTRQVTLRRPDGNTMTVFAGEQVRNLPQLRVGDTVTIEFYDTLALELKKGGTGVPASRADIYSESRAALGQRPGGVTARETVIVADVIAVDAPTQTISLRGPGGRTVILPLRDPEQFKRIAVGDQVEATYVEAAALSITPATTAMSPAAPPWGRWMVGARLLDVYPNVSTSVSGIDVDQQWTGELNTTYFFNPNFAIEGSITWAKQDVTFNGTGVGALKMMPVTVTAQYHFTNLGAWKPYVGGGFNYTYFYDTDLGNNAGASVSRDSWGGALQAGLDYQVQRNWYFNIDVKYLWINNDIGFNNVNFGNSSSLDIDPWLIGVGVRYRF